ncbi:hypothetical protein EC988_007233 [Linderina pennispora]|nr:hypothetical protein EC988_007233 [Linderina pennispora]
MAGDSANTTSRVPSAIIFSSVGHFPVSFLLGSMYVSMPELTNACSTADGSAVVSAPSRNIVTTSLGLSSSHAFTISSVAASVPPLITLQSGKHKSTEPAVEPL